MLGEMSLSDQEIDDFFISFEDEFLIDQLDRFRWDTFSFVPPGTGWTNKTENGIYVTGLDDWEAILHPSPETYGHTILHELGHIDYFRKKPEASNGDEKHERIAERFARKNAHLVDDLVDYEVNADAVNKVNAQIHPYDARARTRLRSKWQQEADKLLLKRSRQV